MDPRPSRRVLALGLTGALLTYAGVVLLWVLAVPLFVPSDETTHVDYAWQVSDGTIPMAGPVLHPEFGEAGQGKAIQHVSNHPPLYHLLVGPLLHLGASPDHAWWTLIGVRVLGAALTGLTMLVVARTAWLVLATAPPRTRAAGAVIAAASSGLVPSLLIASGTIQNDSLAVLLSASALMVLVSAARDGLTCARVWALGALCALAMLTRISCLPVVLVAAGGALVLGLWPRLVPLRPTWGSVGRALGAVVVVLGCPLLASGWFYALNVRRYGDVTGGDLLYTMPMVLGRPLAPGAGHGLLAYLVAPRSWWMQVRQLGGLSPSVLNDPWDDHPVSTWLGVALLVIAALGIVATLVRRGPWRLDRVGLASLVCLAGVLVAAYVTMGDHVLHRGLENNRYLLTGVPFLGVAAAVLLTRLGRATPLVGTAVVAVLGTASVNLTTSVAGRLSDPGTPWVPALARGLATNRVDEPHAVLYALLAMAVLGLVLLLGSLTTLSRRSPE